MDFYRRISASCEEFKLRLEKFLLWISTAEFPDAFNRAFRQAEILAVDFRRRISTSCEEVKLSLGKFSLWISAAEFPPVSCEEVKLRQEKFLLWISATEFPNEYNISRRAFRQADILLWISAAEFYPDTSNNNPIFSLWTSAVSNCLLLWFCFWHVGLWHVPSGIGISSCSGTRLPNGAQGVHPSRRRLINNEIQRHPILAVSLCLRVGTHCCQAAPRRAFLKNAPTKKWD